MPNHRDSNFLLGLRFEGHHEMLSSLLIDSPNPTLRKYEADSEDLLNDIKLVAERLKAKGPEKSIPDTSEEHKAIKFTYTNYRGETSIRNAIVLGTYWGNTEWHPEYGMLMRAYDLDKFEIRDFALKDCDFTKTE